jgi:hypothetical protein
MTREEVERHLKKNHFDSKVEVYMKETEDLDGKDVWGQFDNPEDLEDDFNMYEFCVATGIVGTKKEG